MTAITHDRVIGVQYTPITEEDIFEEERHKKQHTLEEFAVDHFSIPGSTPQPTTDGSRPPPKSSISRRQGIVTKDLWSHTRVPMKQPLLKSLQNEPELAREACQIFKTVLKYSGEYKTTKTNSACAFTDSIFGPPLAEVKLRDELYCQLIKQLTGNKQNNDIPGWELMWLATGTFPCTEFVREQVDKFLKTARRRWLAKDCIERLNKTSRKGCRLYPPNLVEVETIKFKMTKILNTVYYPNDTEGFFEVDSGTKVRDFEAAIMERLELQPSQEFKLFVKIADTVVGIPQDMFFYDYMRHDHLAQQAKPPRTETDPDEIYQMVALIFMRKTWANMVPGDDPKADEIFHYHQEVPKFLLGWHRSSKEDTIRMAALIVRAKTVGNKKFGKVAEDNMPPMNELVPQDKLGNMLEEEWRKVIFAAYQQNDCDHKTAAEVKSEFINIIYQWPCFGSAFVDVKQKSFPTLKPELLLALNKNGLNFLDPESREIEKCYPFSQIVKFKGDQGYFEIAIKGDTKKGAHRFDTELGYKVADLIAAYKAVEERSTRSEPEL